jgi:hypothetical protein
MFTTFRYLSWDGTPIGLSTSRLHDTHLQCIRLMPARHASHIHAIVELHSTIILYNAKRDRERTCGGEHEIVDDGDRQDQEIAGAHGRVPA